MTHVLIRHTTELFYIACYAWITSAITIPILTHVQVLKFLQDVNSEVSMIISGYNCIRMFFSVWLIVWIFFFFFSYVTQNSKLFKSWLIIGGLLNYMKIFKNEIVISVTYISQKDMSGTWKVAVSNLVNRCAFLKVYVQLLGFLCFFFFLFIFLPD